jgi:hypothetical protein
MIMPPLPFRAKSLQKVLLSIFLTVILAGSLWWGTMAPAEASLDDDRLDGNIFVVYAGNGSLVPAKLSLAQSLAGETPTVLVYYLDDSRDAKQFAFVVSRVQEFYGRAANIIPISVDKIPAKNVYQPNEEGYYYKGYVPQTVIFDQTGKVVFDDKGLVPYEKLDDALRKVFSLVPRSQSSKLQQRTFNEFNSELVETNP